MMRWLITGGCGFIGCNLIQKLVGDKNHSIRVLDNLSVGSLSDLGTVADVEILNVGSSFPSESRGKVQLLVGDIRDPQTVADAAHGVDIIVHLAANTGVNPSVENPREDCLSNVFGTLNVLEAARAAQVRRVVFASSGAPLGEQTPPLHERLPPAPASPYGASKLAGEGYCSAYWHSFGIETVALRFGNIYGPGSGHKQSVVAKFIRQALDGETWVIYGDGRQTRDFIFISDLIEAVIRAAQADSIGGEIFQIAANCETTVREIATILSVALKDAGIAAPAIQHAEHRPGDVTRNFSDISKARTRLGWSPSVRLEDGLARTVAWFLRDRK